MENSHKVMIQTSTSIRTNIILQDYQSKHEERKQDDSLVLSKKWWKFDLSSLSTNTGML